MEDIRAIANTQFNEMIENAPNDTYIVAFFLNPGMSGFVQYLSRMFTPR